MNKLTQTYKYMAGGKTVSLRPDTDYVGVHLPKLDETQRQEFAALPEGSVQEVGTGIAMIGKSHLSGRLLDSLQKADALFPVFADHGTRVIALPEVRVEQPAGTAANATLEGLGGWLDKHPGVTIVNEKPDRMVVAPLSGYGPDAVTLAHDISTQFKALSATPRFLRILPVG